MEKNTFLQKLLKEPMTYVTGAVILGLLNIAHLLIFKNGWSVVGPFATWGAKIGHFFGLNPADWHYFANDKARKSLVQPFFKDPATIKNIGIILGALLAALLATQFKVKKIKSGRQVLAACLGGLLMGYGARLANGCNIGALFTSTAALSLSGWIFLLFLLVGVFLGVKLLMKYFI